ncbi:Aminotransferase, DegT/DnrJ/EryC1/StrS family [Olavius algarvensis associated proteobacterium Delta 3]|nr:Aminotransferase, DegT/DnrJ/EryC1/StrS family [Olavius algarvensis associated proteobacterium Delta 3]
MSEQSIAEKILLAIRATLNGTEGRFSLHEPKFSEKESVYIQDCMDSGFVSSVGKYVDRFEQMLAEYTGVRRAVAVVNGTSALHTALSLMGVGQNDEVLVPALTFVATANAVTYTGGLPHFIDCDEETLGVDPLKLENYLGDICQTGTQGCKNRLTGRRIKAIVVTHTFGHPVDLDPIEDLCRRFGLVLIEDAAEAIGSLYKGSHVGNRGDLSILSFNGNKTITTGGGGALLCNDDALGDLAKHVTTTAKVPHPWSYVHDRIGYNYRMPNINAALGCGQLEQLPSFIERKRSLARRYAAAFKAVPAVRFFQEPEYARSNYWLNAILLDTSIQDSRDDVLTLTNRQGIMTRPVWTLMHKLPMYQKNPRMDLTTSESIEKRLINIPSSPIL